MSGRIDIAAIFDWLVDGAPGADGTPAILQKLGADLAAAGVRVARIATFVRTLHPSVIGRGFVWRRGVADVRIIEPPYAFLGSDDYVRSPVNVVALDGRELRRRLDGNDPLEYAVFDELRADGLTDYFSLPLRFVSGEMHAVTWATDAGGGFSDEELDALRTLSRPLGRIAEILALRRTAVALLSAYVGRDAGERILRGQVQRGDTESIRCVIWFSDLRGFTSMSGRTAPGEIITLLNRVFDCQVPAVERHGGEVLKFMGDGMLAIFPIRGPIRGPIPGPTRGPIGADDSAAVCASAIAAVDEAFAALDQLNRDRDAPPLGFGVALHVGDVAYGNIGGATRLDFTAIGPAVNLASRIEGLTSKLGKRLLVSAEFAQAAALPMTLVGSFELKGVEARAPVYEPQR